MDNLSGFFSKFTHILEQKNIEEQAVIDGVKEFTGYVLEKSSIKIKDGVLSLGVNSAIKTQIFFKRVEFISYVNKKCDKEIIREVR